MTDAVDDDVEEPILVSAIAQWAYCPRRCALIFAEQEFEENVFTLQGRALHERPDLPLTTWEGEKRIERGVLLVSEELGLVGRADTVEFSKDGTVRPVEYKRGARFPRRCDDLQLCAQALCLEEMLRVPVPSGAVFYHASRRQRQVIFTEELRTATREAIEEVRRLLRSGETPPPVNDSRCHHCSLNAICLPEALADGGKEDDLIFATDLVEEGLS